MKLSLTHSHSHDDNNPDDHEHDMVMPGFRFHPTEEELLEFYLRRKVEGKRFNIELITFLYLYRYDPWELPALAAIGEKEWYFYVPRDRKYRNGDRPNRVTASGYWKATGADRIVRTENFRSIGLKKTLVFYSGKAPKGIRTSWVMNEYRLPQHETQRYQKAEISLCRVYKRAGVEDHPSLARCLPSKGSHSDKKQSQMVHLNTGIDKMNETEGSDNGSDVTPALGLPLHNAYRTLNTMMGQAVSMEEQGLILMQQSKQAQVASSLVPIAMADELNWLVSYQQQYYSTVQSYPNQFSSLLMQPPPAALNSLAIAFSERQWEWNPIPEANREYSNMSFNY